MIMAKSDMASHPKVAIDMHGVIHAIWWDPEMGEMYSLTGSGIDARWLTPAPITAITAGQVGKVKQASAPVALLIAGGADAVHAFWYSAGQELDAVTYQDNTWGAPFMIAAVSAGIDAYSDISGTIRMAYVRTVDRPGSPAGVYYRASYQASTALGWSDQRVIFPSPHFYTAALTDTHISIAGDASGRMVVAWQTAHVGMGYARSIDGGITWQAIPSLIAGPVSPMEAPVVGATSDGNFVMLWRHRGASGCTLTQRRSRDGGATWDVPEAALTGAPWCTAALSIKPDSQNRLWLQASPGYDQSEGQGATTGPGIGLAVWDGKAWLALRDSDLALPASSVLLDSTDIPDCRDIAMNAMLIVVVGCGKGGDIWYVRSTTPIEQISVVVVTPTPTPLPATSTVIATATLLPTAMPTPTQTPTQVPTVTPSATPLPTATATPVVTVVVSPGDYDGLASGGLNQVDLLLISAALAATGVVVLVIRRFTHPSSRLRYNDEDSDPG